MIASKTVCTMLPRTTFVREAVRRKRNRRAAGSSRDRLSDFA
jgi:hypothetical protein